MIGQHDRYEELAIESQTRSTAVGASRGTIYDRNMNILAKSATVENVFLDPNGLKNAGMDLDLVAGGLSQILGVSEEFVREQAADTTKYYKVIKRRITADTADRVRAFLNEHRIIGVYLEPDTMRYYPYSTLASQVIGFVNADNSGAEGLEARYNEILSGTSGEIIRTRGAGDSEMLYSYETYYDAADGCSLVLTLDTTVQYYLEKAMENAIAKYDIQKGAFGIVMEVDTGAILGMATLGGYDPNNYLEICDPDTEQLLAELRQARDRLPEGSEAYEAAHSTYVNALAAARQSQWRNRCTSDGYEPGSTFKTITLAAALEDGAVSLGSSFFCGGSTQIAGRSKPLHCWKSAGHGSQSTAQALQNSCNIAFANIGISLGGERFYEYVEAFGLTEKTGIDLYGEGSGFFFEKSLLTKENSYASLTSGAFGQTFKVTPLQLVRAIAAVVNGGYLMEPYLVSDVLDGEGDLISHTEPTVLRQVISEETSRTMCALMESVVSEGTARNAQLIGYRIGGKTGTSEKIDVLDENGQPVKDRLVSFVGVAPMDDPQYIILVALDTPSSESGIYISGGQMAAPTVREVLADVLPYLGVEPDYSGEDPNRVNVEMPELSGMTADAAARLLTERGLSWDVLGEGITVTDQIPEAGTSLPGGSCVRVYTEGTAPSETVSMPELSGMTAAEAETCLTAMGLYLQTVGAEKTASGDVIVTGQDIPSGIPVMPGTVVTAELTDVTAGD